MSEPKSWADAFQAASAHPGESVVDFAVTAATFRNFMDCLIRVPWDVHQAACRDGTFTMYDPSGVGVRIVRQPAALESAKR